MPLALVPAVGLVMGLSLWLFPPATAHAQPKPPPDFTFPQGKDSTGPVTFSHTKHAAAGNDKCTACHTKVFKMKKGASGPLTMAKMEAGQQCGTCHNGKTKVKDTVVFAVDACERCHKN